MKVYSKPKSQDFYGGPIAALNLENGRAGGFMSVRYDEDCAVINFRCDENPERGRHGQLSISLEELLHMAQQIARRNATLEQQK